MKLYVKSFLIFLLSSAVIPRVCSQSLPDSTIKKIDSLYAKLNTVNSPGCTIGIVMNDQLIYSKGYGMANLEYAIPNTAATIFHMASVSKQFTAYSIILLARQGKLELDDDIHKYLSWFPDLKEKITIRNLLNHTSGIRDQNQLLFISGTRLEDVVTQEHIVKILSKQQALNFKPGHQYLYSSSGFTMLAEIVKSVSGQSLRKFTDSAIFKPLGMNETHSHDDYTEIEKNRSYSYNQIDSAHFANHILSNSNVGPTSLLTNIPDMSKWIINFYNPKAGDQEDIERLTQKAKLNNGRELTYASGIVVNSYKGWRQYSHEGRDAGYRTFVTVFPDLKMGFIVFGNLGELEPSVKAYEMADLFIKNTAQETAIKKAPRDSSVAFLNDTLSLHKFLGSYIGEDGLPLDFDMKESRLYYHLYDQTSFLIKELKDTFSIPASPDTKFVFGIKGKDTTVEVNTPEQQYHLKKYTRVTLQSDDILKTYTGIYYCAELDCKYGIVLKDHQLMLTNAKYNDTKLTCIGRDHLTNDFWEMGHLQILRDNKNQVTGFEVNSYGIMHLKFVKLETSKH